MVHARIVFILKGAEQSNLGRSSSLNAFKGEGF